MTPTPHPEPGLVERLTDWQSKCFHPLSRDIGQAIAAITAARETLRRVRHIASDYEDDHPKWETGPDYVGYVEQIDATLAQLGAPPCAASPDGSSTPCSSVPSPSAGASATEPSVFSTGTSSGAATARLRRCIEESNEVLWRVPLDSPLATDARRQIAENTAQLGHAAPDPAAPAEGGRFAFPVGEYLQEELEARGWSVRTLATKMRGNVDVNHCALELLINVHDKALLLGDDMACELGRVFGTGPDIWKRLDAAWRATPTHPPQEGYDDAKRQLAYMLDTDCGDEAVAAFLNANAHKPYIGDLRALAVRRLEARADRKPQEGKCPTCGKPKEYSAANQWVRDICECKPAPVAKAGCYDCGLDYGSPAWADVVIPDELWNKISPSDDPGCGLLCFNCMNKRLRGLGLRNVPYEIASGPFCFMVRDITGETREAFASEPADTELLAQGDADIAAGSKAGEGVDHDAAIEQAQAERGGG